MKAKRVRENGFVLFLVLVTMILVGAEMFVLAGGSNTILFQADNAYLQAVEQNLTASGLAWAKKNFEDENLQSVSETIELFLADINIKKAALSIFVKKGENEGAEVQINASCNRGGHILRRNKKYQIYR